MLSNGPFSNSFNIFLRLHMRTFAMEQPTGTMSMTRVASGIFLKYSAPRQILQETISRLMYKKRCPCV